MKLKTIVESIVKEYLNEENDKETLEQFYKRFKIKNPNSDFLENNFRNPNFRLELVHDGNVKIKKYHCSLPNRCETNTFNFIKDMVTLNNHRYYPVSGWAFLDSTSYFEHFWVYDAIEDIFIDVTPMGDDLPYAYGGVINFKINNDIKNAKEFNEIPFLLGKVSFSLYHKYMDNKPNPKLVKSNNKKDILDYIHSNEEYSELSDLIKNDNRIQNLEDLKKLLPKLKDNQLNTRNNREYDLYEKIINQIKSIDL
jgi:hypothetical protein